MKKLNLFPFIPKKLAAWLRGPAAPKAPRNVRVQSTTPRTMRFEGPVHAPVPRETFVWRLKSPRTEGPAACLGYVSRKARREAKRGDTGQHPKPLPARRVRAQHEHPRDADGRAFTLIGQRTAVYGTDEWNRGVVQSWRPGRRIWLGGLSAQRGY